MSATPRELIQKQIKRVRRRLVIRSFLETVILFWAGALALSAAWFLARPFLLSTRAEGTFWGIPGAILAGATLAAFIWSFVKRPPFVAASLALDEQFNLRERVTTFLLLSEHQAESPAGQALLGDVKDKVADLDVPRRFPIRLRWTRALLPVGAGLLAFAASFFDPTFSTARNNQSSRTLNQTDAKEVEQLIVNLKKATLKEKDEELKSDKLRELETELEKLAQKPLDPTSEEQVRERANELRNLEDKMKDQVEKLKSKASSKEMKKHLEKLGLDKLGKKMKEGPAKDFQDALAKGKLDKAREALEKLQKDLENNNLSKEEQKQLAEQMKDLQDKLQRLADQKDEKDQLQKDFEQGKIDRDTLDRELERMEQEAAEMQDLQDLAELLGDCKECLRNGQNGKASGRLKALISRLKEMELGESEMARLIKDMEALEACRCQMLGRCQGNRNGLGQGGPPGGVRPVGPEDPSSKIVDKRQKGESDPRGQQRVTGFVKGGSFSKIPAKEVAGAFKQAVQDAPEAIDRQRIPPDYADIARGYFQKLGGQK
ncbi:MAG: hypothetical protein HY040_25875 [Planctomycetes bacterium]|nr:hypothetical protein [Planctomycetota bacterium]